MCRWTRLLRWSAILDRNQKTQTTASRKERRAMKSKRIVLVALAALLLTIPQPALAKDDFGQIVRHIEVTYNVHRQHRFVMGLAGFVVKFWHIAGVKNFKGAIFEDQPFVNAAMDTRFDQVVRAAMNSGWQPMVQEWD